MRKFRIIDKARGFLALAAWKIFLWVSETTEAEYTFNIVQENSDYP